VAAIATNPQSAIIIPTKTCGIPMSHLTKKNRHTAAQGGEGKKHYAVTVKVDDLSNFVQKAFKAA
jgi:hypothetical protein